MCFSETWFKLKEGFIDSFICKRMDGMDRGICIYVNKQCYCLPDIELITVGLRPHYLPREFHMPSPLAHGGLTCDKCTFLKLVNIFWCFHGVSNLHVYMYVA